MSSVRVGQFRPFTDGTVHVSLAVDYDLALATLLKAGGRVHRHLAPAGHSAVGWLARFKLWFVYQGR
jgi:hypothetical protein